MKLLKINQIKRIQNTLMQSLTFIFVIFCTGFAFSSNSPLDKTNIQIEFLTQQKWVLSEVINTKNDTATNLTVFLLPCEKDNFTEYAQEGTYKIFEGQSKCENNSENILGNGTWEMDADDNSLIIETYQGGREIEKKIVQLSEDTFILEFESEGNTTTKLTFFSQNALQTQPELIERVEDPNNHSQTLTKLIQDILIEKGGFIIVNKKELNNDNPLDLDTQDGLLKTVVVYPFEDATKENITLNELEHEETLWAKANKKNIDYVITGSLLQKEAIKNNSQEYEGQVKYSISVLDGNLQCRKGASQIEFPKKGGVSARTITKWVVAARTGLWHRRYGWNSYYSTYWAVNRTKRNMDYVDAVFTASDNASRQTAFQKTTAVQEAFEETMGELTTFIDNKAQLSFKIQSITESSKRGGAKKIKIEAGENCKLKEGDNLEVVLKNTVTLSNGKVVEDNKEIGIITIESVDNFYLSTCRVNSGGKEIKKLVEQNSENLFVITTGKKNTMEKFGIFNK